MKITIRYLGLFKSKFEKENEEIIIQPGFSLKDLWCRLLEKYGEKFGSMIQSDEQNRLDPSFVVTINGIIKNIVESESVMLKEGDEIVLMTLISGGRIF
jgi:molybdopterin converting factor small subunit